MDMLQLSPSVPVDVKGHGTGQAHVLMSYGKDHEPVWIVFLDESGDSLEVLNSAIKKI
jgi:hypothetical protein